MQTSAEKVLKKTVELEMSKKGLKQVADIHCSALLVPYIHIGYETVQKQHVLEHKNSSVIYDYRTCLLLLYWD